MIWNDFPWFRSFVYFPFLFYFFLFTFSRVSVLCVCFSSISWHSLLCWLITSENNVNNPRPCSFLLKNSRFIGADFCFSARFSFWRRERIDNYKAKGNEIVQSKCKRNKRKSEISKQEWDEISHLKWTSGWRLLHTNANLHAANRSVTVWLNKSWTMQIKTYGALWFLFRSLKVICFMLTHMHVSKGEPCSYTYSVKDATKVQSEN